MAIKTRAEILESLKSFIGESTDDNALSLIEDITDTMVDFETKVSDPEDWKSRYEQNDKEWRQKYRDRFFGSGSDNNSNTDYDGHTSELDNPETRPTAITFDDIFTEKG